MVSFRPMRRIRQQLSDEESIRLLSKATSGVLSLIGEGGYPYGVPMSFVFRDGHIYMHSTRKGYKIDSIQQNEKACFTIIFCDEVHGEKFTTYFRSVICFGIIHVVSDEQQRLDAIHWIASKYSQENTKVMDREIASCGDAMCILDFTIQHFSGKEAIELTRQHM